jgi:DNA-directed RNA polymerase specialized sigma24 family protein
MAVSLKHEELVRVLMLIKNNPGNEQVKNDYLETLKPIIKLTSDRFPSNLADDLQQEIKIFLMKRAEYISNTFFEGKIKDPTSYIFTVCRNAAMNFFKKESKHTLHIIPIDDVKIDPIYKPKTYQKQKCLDEVRVQMLSFIKTRFTNRKEQKQAERFLTVLMEGKRPSFDDKVVEPFAKTKAPNAKDIYSIILMKLRELLQPRIKELLE